MPSIRAVGAALALPWTAFVAAFLYYAVLTLVVIGAGELSAVFMAVSYLLPAVAYGAALARRAVAALSRMPVVLWPTSELVLH